MVGIQEKNSRNLVKAIVNKDPEVMISLSFLSYYHDEKSLRQCIRESRIPMQDVLIPEFKNNPRRVDKILDELVKTRFPLTRCQLDLFACQYAGRPAMVQDNVAELVDIPMTNHGFEEMKVVEDESICFVNETSSKSCTNLDILLYSFKVEICVKRIQCNWRRVLRKRKFDHILYRDDIQEIAKRSLSRSRKKAWIGFQFEGLSLELFLGRIGIMHCGTSIMLSQSENDIQEQAVLAEVFMQEFFLSFDIVAVVIVDADNKFCGLFEEVCNTLKLAF